MTSIETLKDRIAKAEAFIEKKGATISKKTDLINKKKVAIAMGKADAQWTQYEIESLEDDIKRLMADREDKEKSLKQYRIQLDEAMNVKRDCKPLCEFLDGWKERVKAWYLKMEKDWTRLDAYNNYLRADTRACNYWNSGRTQDVYNGKLTKEEAREKYESLRKEATRLKEAYYNTYGEVHELVQKAFCTKVPYADLVEKMLQREWESKYDDLIYRATKYVGQFTDVDHLKIGSNGSINGYIEGTNGKAKVETIWAGGWNIQCRHFRVLIHKMK